MNRRLSPTADLRIMIVVRHNLVEDMYTAEAYAGHEERGSLMFGHGASGTGALDAARLAFRSFRLPFTGEPTAEECSHVWIVDKTGGALTMGARIIMREAERTRAADKRRQARLEAQFSARMTRRFGL